MKLKFMCEDCLMLKLNNGTCMFRKFYHQPTKKTIHSLNPKKLEGITHLCKLFVVMKPRKQTTCEIACGDETQETNCTVEIVCEV